MRSWLLMFLLLVAIFIQDAQGIRLTKATTSSPADRQHSSHELVPGGWKRSNINEEVIMCKSNKCGSGRIRKLTMIHISSTTTINTKNNKNEETKADPKLEAQSSTNQKIGKKGENVSVNSWSEAEQGQPETIDIAGMDYSLQARRRPPIHN